jgi:2-polyprenyl-3-methyl-5-hydroxy-6-metoxy-1,4-benzoquinol methylase
MGMGGAGILARLESLAVEDEERARTYFDKLAPEYDRAFQKRGRDPLNALVNRFFRGRTFVRRMELLETLLAELSLPGKSVLDLGCGSGQVSLVAASLGAEVHGIDIAPRMLAIARETAERTGLAARVRFEEGDVSTAPLPQADVSLLIGVIEYYRDHQAVLRRVADSARQTLIVGHTSRVAYRMALRKALFAIDGSNLYFHRMKDVIASVEAAGMSLRREIKEHAFSLLVFQKARNESGPSSSAIAPRPRGQR